MIDHQTETSAGIDATPVTQGNIWIYIVAYLIDMFLSRQYFIIRCNHEPANKLNKEKSANICSPYEIVIHITRSRSSLSNLDRSKFTAD